MNRIAEALETGQAQEVAGAFLDAVERFDQDADVSALVRAMQHACRMAEDETCRVSLDTPKRLSDGEIRDACIDFAAIGYSRSDVAAFLGYSRSHFSRNVLARVDPDNRIQWPSRGWCQGHRQYQMEQRPKVTV